MVQITCLNVPIVRSNLWNFITRKPFRYQRLFHRIKAKTKYKNK